MDIPSHIHIFLYVILPSSVILLCKNLCIEIKRNTDVCVFFPDKHTSGVHIIFQVHIMNYNKAIEKISELMAQRIVSLVCAEVAIPLLARYGPICTLNGPDLEAGAYCGFTTNKPSVRYIRRKNKRGRDTGWFCKSDYIPCNQGLRKKIVSKGKSKKYFYINVYLPENRQEPSF